MFNRSCAIWKAITDNHAPLVMINLSGIEIGEEVLCLDIIKGMPTWVQGSMKGTLEIGVVDIKTRNLTTFS